MRSYKTKGIFGTRFQVSVENRALATDRSFRCYRRCSAGPGTVLTPLELFLLRVPPSRHRHYTTNRAVPAGSPSRTRTPTPFCHVHCCSAFILLLLLLLLRHHRPFYTPRFVPPTLVRPAPRPSGPDPPAPRPVDSISIVPDHSFSPFTLSSIPSPE